MKDSDQLKYIDAEKIIAEIEKQMKDVERHSDLGGPDDLYYDGRRSILVMLRSFIDSLQQEQPEVDLDEEINRFWDSCIKHKNERGGNVIWSNKIEIEALACYFYELGLNARKEE